MLRILAILLFVSSCASSAERDWGEWQRVGVSQAEEEWHFCQKELDGPEYHEKGHCYQAQECRYRRTIFNNKKSQCRNKVLFCKWGDVQCLYQNNLFNKVIKNSEVK